MKKMKNPIEELLEMSNKEEISLPYLIRVHGYLSGKITSREVAKGNYDIVKPYTENSIYDHAHKQAIEIMKRYVSLRNYKKAKNAANEMDVIDYYKE